MYYGIYSSWSGMVLASRCLHVWRNDVWRGRRDIGIPDPPTNILLLSEWTLIIQRTSRDHWVGAWWWGGCVWQQDHFDSWHFHFCYCWQRAVLPWEYPIYYVDVVAWAGKILCLLLWLFVCSLSFDAYSIPYIQREEMSTLERKRPLQTFVTHSSKVRRGFVISEKSRYFVGGILTFSHWELLSSEKGGILNSFSVIHRSFSSFIKEQSNRANALFFSAYKNNSKATGWSISILFIKDKHRPCPGGCRLPHSERQQGKRPVTNTGKDNGNWHQKRSNDVHCARRVATVQCPSIVICSPHPFCASSKNVGFAVVCVLTWSHSHRWFLEEVRLVSAFYRSCLPWGMEAQWTWREATPRVGSPCTIAQIKLFFLLISFKINHRSLRFSLLISL